VRRRSIAPVAAAHRASLRDGSGSSAWKIGVSGVCAGDDAVACHPSNASPESCQQPARPNRSGESGATALSAPATRFTHCAVTPRTRRRPARPSDEPPPPGRRDGGGLRRSDYSRRDTRQSAKRRGSAPIGGGRESLLPHPAPRCRHDSSRTRGSSPPPPAAAAPARTRRFAAASNRSERPAHRRCIDRHWRPSYFGALYGTPIARNGPGSFVASLRRLSFASAT